MGLLDDAIPATMSQQEKDLRLKLNDFETPTHMLMQKWYEQQQQNAPRQPAPGQVGTTQMANEAGLRQMLRARGGLSPAQVEQMIQQHKINKGLR